jgi:hypothetical protein
MKLYIANCSMQQQDFVYRMIENPAPRRQMIEVGGQIQISGNLRTEDIDFIVEQHGIYGLFDASTVAQTQRHIYLLYAVDKPVTANQMRQALERNLEIMGIKGVELRKEAALAVDDTLQKNSPPGTYRESEFEVRQEISKSHPDVLVNESITVRRQGLDTPPPMSRKQRRRAA